MKKKALSILLVFVLMFSSFATVSADTITPESDPGIAVSSSEGDEITLYWNYATSVDYSLSIKSGKAYVELGYGLVSSSYNCRVYSRLQRQTTSGWSTVKTYDKTSTSRYYMDDYTQALSTKGNYRLYTIFYVKNSAGTTIETISTYSYATY